MRIKTRATILVLAAMLMAALWAPSSTAATVKTPDIKSISRPLSGATEILFRGPQGPFRIQKRDSLDANAVWVDMPEVVVTELEPGVYLGQFPNGKDNLAFYRVVSEADGISDLKGWTIRLNVSTPSNGVCFVPGESPVVTVSIFDTMAQGVTRADFSSLNLYMFGPQDPWRTVTASKMLNASTDRSQAVHHYIDLAKNADVQVNGDVLTYRLKPVSNEAPGTYTVALWARLASDNLQQVMRLSDVQIVTGAVEKDTVNDPTTGVSTCAKCHQGTVSGKMYMHHIDPGFSPTGNFSLDYEPIRSCKACHNNDGYAAYTDASAPGGKVTDRIERRVHGVHMGEGLSRPFNTNAVNGDFRNYTSVVFPSDVRNCTECHVDNRWRTNPSRQACGSCHDRIWFGTNAERPADMLLHSGGVQTSDGRCAACHLADGGGSDAEALSVTAAHYVAPTPFRNRIEFSITPPANGKYFTAGDKPQISMKVLDAATGAVISPATIAEPAISTNVHPIEWRSAEFYVYGPRANSVPVLTTAAALKSTTASRGSNDVRVRLKASNEDPAVKRTADSIVYQLADVGTLTPGTYTAYLYVRPATGFGATAKMNFNVGSTNEESQIAPFSVTVNGTTQGCVTCHADGRIHATSRADLMDPEVCKACHDNLHQIPGKTAWTGSGQSQFGFGVSPIVRRVHGIHYGRYLSNPTNNTSGISEIIFPQDVRNCTKCHADPKNSTWNEKPSRLACFSCHDDLSSIAHGNIMTADPTPADPWSGDEVESCEVCHGSDTEFSPKRVHAISDPYVPPYIREP